MPRTQTRKVSRKVARAMTRKLTRKTVRRSNRKLATVGLVKKLIHRNVESKYIGKVYNASFNNRIDSAADIIPLLPSLTKGTGDNNRIGNKITPRGIRVAVTVTANDVTPGAGFELLPRIMFLSSRSEKDTTLLPTFDTTILLDDGTGERAFGGDISDYHSPLNTEMVTIHKDIKTQICLGTVEQNLARTRTYVFWIKCPKVLHYNDNTTFPENFAPFMCAGFACGDFSVPSDGYLGIKIGFTSTLYYEDA